MGIYILKRKFLIELLEDSAAKGYTDLVMDIIIRSLDSMRIYAYIFTGYWRPLNSIQLYYRANMDLLDPRIRRELLMDRRKIYTKVKDEAPAKYNEEACVKNSIVADGCIIEGTVENSILNRGVCIGKEYIKTASSCRVHCRSRRAAQLLHTDKGVIITTGKTSTATPRMALIVGKNITVSYQPVSSDSCLLSIRS